MIFTDRGKAFLEKKEQIIPKYYKTRTATYPPPIHQYLSPNDNHYHGAAKARWEAIKRRKKWGPGDTVKSELCLLNLLTYTREDVIKEYFEKNLFLGQPLPHKRTCLKMISENTPAKSKREQFFDGCLRAYRNFVANTPPSESTHTQQPTSKV